MDRQATLGQAFCGLKRFAVLLLALFSFAALPGGAQAQNATIVVNKKACSAASLPAGIQSASNAAALLDDCADIASVPANTLFHYVITINDISPTGQIIDVSDALPSAFSTASAPPAFCVGCNGGSGLAPNLSSISMAGGGDTIHIVVPGYFTQGGPFQNTATVKTGDGGTTASLTHSLLSGTPVPPKGNLKVEKNASISSGSIAGGSLTVTYSITVTNTGGSSISVGDSNPDPLVDSQIFQLVDNASALPGSSLGFNYSVSPVNFAGCDPFASLAPGNISCPDNQLQGPSGVTTNASTGSILGVWTYAPNDPGIMGPGTSYTLTFDVTYEFDPTVLCVWPNTSNGVRNTAFIRFANGQIAFSDWNASDNTSFADLEITDHGIIDECERIDDQLTIEKVQKSPVGVVPWGTPVQYVITVSNPAGIGQTGVGVGPAASNINVVDTVQMLPGMPVVAVTAQSIQCLTSGITCSSPVPPPVSTQTLTTYYQTINAASITVDSLGDGQSVEIAVVILFEPRSCVSYETAGPRQTADIASHAYEIKNKFGQTFAHGKGSTAVVTDHDTVPPCTLKTEKTGPKQIQFGMPFQYKVTYENYGNRPIDVGTLIDAISLSSPVYAPSVQGQYTYGCAWFINGTPQQWGPLNLVGGNSTPQNFAVSYNAVPGQGTKLLHNLNPGAPITFPANSRIECTIKMTLFQPTAANPYCQGAGDPRLVNHALMDASYHFNTNYDPNAPTPPPGSPVGLPDAYASTSAGMPLCHEFKVAKLIDPKIAEPNEIVTVTLSLTNNGDNPISGATLSDSVPANLTPISGTLNCALCAPALVNAPISGQTVAVAFGSLNAGQAGVVTFQAVANAPTPLVQTNTVKGDFVPPPGNWYDQDGTGPHAFDFNYGVFEKEPVTITKQVVNMAPQPFPTGPFPISVNCTLPGYPQLGWSYGHTASVTMPAGSTSFSVQLPVELPVGAVCTFVETSVPSGSAPYGFSAVGYQPPAGGGLSGSLTVVAKPAPGIDNTAVVENCHGTPGLPSALQQPHAVGKDCPPVIDPLPEYRIDKICSPAVLAADGISHVANCEVIAWTSGEFPAGYSVQENFNAIGQIAHVGEVSTPPSLNWNCSPQSAAAPGSINCAFTGGAQQPGGPNQVSHHFTVTFDSRDAVESAKNCAYALVGDSTVGEDCEAFTVGKVENKYDIEKACGPVGLRKYPVNAYTTGIAHFSDCTITVTVVPGPVIGMLSVTESFGSSPNNTALITALSGAGWTCNPQPLTGSPIPAGTPVTCTMPGGLFAANSVNGQSTITATVMVPSGVDTVKNCAGLLLNDEKLDASCADIILNTAPRVQKICETPYRPVGSSNWMVNCAITITPTGPMTGTILVNDVMSVLSGSATITSVNPGVWSCSPATPITTPNAMSCTAPGASLTGPTTIGLTMSVPAGTTGLANCASTVISEVEGGRSCVDIPIPEDRKADIEKKCDPVAWDAASQRFTTKCLITIAPPSPAFTNGSISFVEQMTAAGAPAQLTGLAASGWSCIPATVPPMISSPLQVMCHRPAAGFTGATITADVAFPQGTLAVKNCAKLHWTAQPPASAQQLAPSSLLDKSCATLEPVKVPVKAGIEKTCTTATLLPAPNPTGAYGSVCTVSVATSGPIAGPLTFSEALAASGTTTFAGSSPAGWTCSPATVANSGAMACSYSGAINPVSDAWTVTFNMTFPTATSADTARNCVRLAAGNTMWGHDCHDFDVVQANPPTLGVTKTCAVLQQYTDDLALLDCTITVTATGSPLPSLITLTELLQSTNSVPNSFLSMLGVGSADPWVCPSPGSAVPPNTPLTCTIAGSAFPSSGTSTLHAYMYSDANITPGSTQNCASVGGNSVPPVNGGPACVPIGPGVPNFGTLNVFKTATLNGQNIPPTNFPVTVTCGTTATNLTVTNDGPAANVSNIPLGSACTVAEGTPPTSGVCPTGHTASWATSYSPASPVTLTAQNANASVTINNVLTCTPVVQPSNGRLIVKKTVTQNGQPVPALSATFFPVTVTCAGSNPIGSNVSVNAPWSLNGLSTSQACTVQEGAPTTNGVCPAGSAASWTTSYAPSGPVTPSATGTTVTVTNNLTCTPVAPTGGQLSVTKTCAPAIPHPLGGVTVTCTITASVTGGPVPAVITLTEKLDELIALNPGAAQIIALASPEPWTFPSVPVNSEVNAPLTLNGSALPSSGTSTISVTMRIANAAMLGELQNCVSGSGGPAGGAPATTAPQVCAQFAGPPPNIVVPPSCDAGTARLVGNICRCTVRGMVPVSKTACACPEGQDLRNGRCAGAAGEPPPPPSATCDGVTAKVRGERCACIYRNMEPVSKTSCGCRKGFRFQEGEGCVREREECKRGLRFNDERNRCEPVCKEGTRYSVRRNACIEVREEPKPQPRPECPRGQVFVPDLGRCVEQQRP